MNQSNIIQLTNNETNLFIELDNYFKENQWMELISKINQGESPITLRLLDIQVQNHENYKSALGTYSKKYFDPFRRSCKFDYEYSNNKFINTSIGQLNFFRYAIESNFLQKIMNENNIIVQ